MKSKLTNILSYSLGLFVMSLVLPGVKVVGGIPTFIFGGIILYLMFLIIKPILSIITLPLSFLTLGTFSFFINVIILYLLTLFVSSISVGPFLYSGVKFLGFVIPEIYVNTLFSYIAASLVLSITLALLSWLIKK